MPVSRGQESAKQDEGRPELGKRNPDSPWNPATSVQVTPEEYELQVLEWLRKAAEPLENFNTEHLSKLKGLSGEYEFDVMAEFSIFGGATIIVLVECKRYNKPVERDKVLALYAKIQDVGAHKGMMFSTSGFQRGALQYADAHGIATVTFLDGKNTYETKMFGPSPEPPPYVRLPKYAGYLLSMKNNGIRSCLVDIRHTEYLSGWLLRDPNPELS